MSCLTFYSWMIRFHLHDKTPVGDLARDMKQDCRQVEKAKGYRRNLAYLNLCQASDRCLEAFEEAWKEYEIYKRGIFDARKNR